MPGLDEREPTVVDRCMYCGGEIYAGYPVKRLDEGAGYVHDGYSDNCAQEYAYERVYDAEGTLNGRGEIE